MAITRVGSLVIDLIAESSKYVEELKKANRQTSKFARDVSRSMNNLSGKLAGLAAGYLGLSAVISQTNRAMADAREIENWSRIAGQSVEEFQASAYAVEQYGISMEELGDISKDVADKLGDFTATGGGGFKDFFEQVAPQVGLTAKALQGLSGPDVLIAVKQAMDKANVPMREQIFYLTAIADNAGLLIPLLEDSGQKYHELTQEANDLNIVLSKQDIGNLNQMNRELNKVSNTLQSSFATAVVGASDQLQWLTKQIADAVVYWGMFFDSFRDEPKTIEGLNNKLIELTETEQDLKETLKNMPSEYGYANIWDALFGGQGGSKSQVREELEKVKQQIEAVQLLKNRAMGVPSEPQPPKLPKLPDISKNKSGDGQSTTDAANKIIAANQRILDSLDKQLATEEELINLSYKNRVKKINNLVLTETQLQATGFDTLTELRAAYLEDAKALKNKQLNELKEAEASAKIQSLDALQQSLGYQGQVIERAYQNQIEKIRNLVLTETEIRAAGFETLKQLQDAYIQEADEKRKNSLEALKEENKGFWQSFHDDIESSTQDFSTLWFNTFDKFTSDFGDAVGSAIVEGKNFSDSMDQIAAGFAKSMISALVKIAAQQLVIWLLENTILKNKEKSMVKTVTGDAYSKVQLAGLNAFASTAAIPIIGPGLAPAAAATAIGLTTPMALAATAAAGLSGIAHSGISEIPSEGSWLLEKNERVLSARQNQDLMKFMDNQKSTESVVYSPTVVVEAGASQNEDLAFAEKVIDEVFNRLVQDGKVNGPVRRAMNG
ncbi:hypothetical protein NX722_05605 [Endozoicomonas gorgoniicola]|uniref:Bacteriophage tail tape measure C-terminal domain-containing protein n=1 Tax=Endozoicomonas gorgoniicola TaxID=1234144 RepID=A0ABT3MRY1_9GAMM|nr:hypothetical protein [Endozoicomonas gorgoniicola]MCW7552128.1 hypothetical protein [Endozoicomonas gorgoniicola]